MNISMTPLNVHFSDPSLTLCIRTSLCVSYSHRFSSLQGILDKSDWEKGSLLTHTWFFLLLPLGQLAAVAVPLTEQYSTSVKFKTGPVIVVVWHYACIPVVQPKLEQSSVCLLFYVICYFEMYYMKITGMHSYELKTNIWSWPAMGYTDKLD